MKSKKNSQVLNGKDLINIGIFTALYMVISIAIACTIGMIPLGFMLLPLILPIIEGIPMMLYYTKIKKFGMLLILQVISGIMMILTAMGPSALISGVILGAIAEWILKISEYKSSKGIVLSYAILSVTAAANYVQWFNASENWLEEKAASYGEVYMNTVAGYCAHTWVLPMLIISAFVGGMIGALLGKAVLKKHFVRSGLI